MFINIIDIRNIIIAKLKSDIFRLDKTQYGRRILASSIQGTNERSKQVLFIWYVNTATSRGIDR